MAAVAEEDLPTKVNIVISQKDRNLSKVVQKEREMGIPWVTCRSMKVMKMRRKRIKIKLMIKTLRKWKE